LRAQLLLENAKRLSKDIHKRLDRIRHNISQSSVVGAPEGTSPAGSASVDSTGACGCTSAWGVF
jgi:hypothetical protein